MADRLAGGRLAAVLLDMRAVAGDDLSYREISKRLLVAYGIEVSDETLRGWIASLQSEREGVA